MIGFDSLQHSLMVFTYSVPRLLAVFLLLPAFSKQTMPGLVRNGIAASLALFVFPLAAADAPSGGLPLLEGLGLLAKEMIIGLLIGYGGAVPFWSLESSGFLIDNQRGSTMASSLDPLTGSQTSPLGVLFTQTLVVIFFVGGGFLTLLGAIYESYRLWPVFSFLPRLEWDAVPYFLSLLDRVMALAVLTAAPVVIAMFMSEFALGLISRFAPQLNVFFLAMPVKSAVGLFVLIAYATLLFGFFGDELLKLTAHFRALRALLQ